MVQLDYASDEIVIVQFSLLQATHNSYYTDEVDMFPKTSNPLICFPEPRKRLKTIDIFPWTPTSLMGTRAIHVETLVLMSKNSKILKNVTNDSNR